MTTTPPTGTVPAQHDPFVIHEQGRVVYANDACRSLFQADSPDDIIGKSLSAFLLIICHDSLADQFQRVAADDAEAVGLSVDLLVYHRSRWDGGGGREHHLRECTHSSCPDRPRVTRRPSRL